MVVKWTFRLLAFLLGSVCFSASANQLAIENVEVTSKKSLSFTVKWNNSWNLAGIQAPNNHDAVWLFVKYRKHSEGKWQHLPINSHDTAHAVADTQLLSLHATEDQMGLFIKRNAIGSGDVPLTQIDLDFAQAMEPGNYDFRIFGIEMVFVPTDSFYAGDGASNNTLIDGEDGSPYLIDTNALIPVGQSAGQLTSDGDYPPASDVPAAYPKGYEGFYAMKYEVSQQQYVDFLNTLTVDQQSNHIQANPGDPSGTLAFSGGRNNRNGIVIDQPAQGDQPAHFACDVNADNPVNSEDDGQWRACNFLNWGDLAAFLDWAGLRPMTELEFEKLARGPEQPVEREFAWGTDQVTDANTLTNDGTKHETAVDTLDPNSGLASHGYDGPQGPLRNGFGGSDSSTRLSIGAGYYGALELSGNLWEMCVVLNEQGLDFAGNQGDGKLDEAGFADVPNWPDGNGGGFRGGGWNSGILQEFRDLAVSDRFYVYDAPKNRRKTSGGRGVRSIDTD